MEQVTQGNKFDGGGDGVAGGNGGGARAQVRLCEGGRRRRGSEGEMIKTPSLFIRGWIQGMRGNRGGRNYHVYGRLDFRDDH